MVAVPAAAKDAIMPAQKPIVIAHRGASGERPEHTLAAYELAIEQGADFIEPDLVMTRDGQLVARHENNITDTTDVASRPEFRDRKTSKTIDGTRHSGWFSEDFTLAELKTLRAKERLPLLRRGNTKFDGQFEVPTLREVIALAKSASAQTGRTIGIYPETKHPSYFASIGLPLEAALVAELGAAGWDRADAPVFIQSFEVNNLKALAKLTKVPLIQLMDAEGGPADGAQPSYAAMITPEGLKAVAAYAAGIGPAKVMAVKADGTVTPLVADAHAAGLKVHPWTFRAENFFLPSGLRGGINPAGHGRLGEEISRHLAAGVDGFFTDFPYQGVEARDRHVR
ncbi:glycerophosphodiester phosphodiesterase [Sphingomonas koreensis]|jgi:glycerophosphoryl diester phosphodiesterase|uniref:glycerophosphodiester phosphodiesterase n=2 Tax=Sphingomonas koreensis TaxID=93064 RepID=A0A1L6J946_9SPHN|nr:glycerophosphodiester phosphodiesterase [Sphingomonas koreensis]APR52481.1 glycerophosphodiester phosphodiesterase [Sphingomonas koreensis]MDC7811652.1 glycerophosphodiester phosphodiesterase [Sphingomonas koreensis]RSU17970.1 glycerophosphodiester phosphodiesterase [Sphingomonas koreensis]RSU22137.1 glycerophosphodiester phosphodiesterase [Sphingomonas koreensis]RSU23788.1 glycerophosphodiester phosphodiesterase [Sphingomonas koreensis]